MRKITKQDILEWGNNGTLDRNLQSKATRKGHKHLHNSSARPSVGKIMPAKYRRKHYGKKRGKK